MNRWRKKARERRLRLQSQTQIHPGSTCIPVTMVPRLGDAGEEALILSRLADDGLHFREWVEAMGDEAKMRELLLHDPLFHAMITLGRRIERTRQRETD